MITTYIVNAFEPSDKNVNIKFINEDGLIYERRINIPHLEDGSVDEDYFQEIINGQLRGVENKEKLGVISFIDPQNASNVGITSTNK